MKVLGIDTSAKTASAAICDITDGSVGVTACGSVNTKLTHSQTLMPFVEALLSNSKTALSDIDVFAVSAGPGSFTGLRIGVSAVKGMAYALGKPCRAVSTLLAMAYNLTVYEGLVCAVMDARCSQVYNALFEISGGRITRLCEDRALMIAELERELSEKYPDRKMMLCGDGAELCFDRLGIDDLTLAPPPLRYQSGTGVCYAAAESKDVSAAALMPVYLRLPQAERERLKKLQASGQSV